MHFKFLENKVFQIGKSVKYEWQYTDINFNRVQTYIGIIIRLKDISLISRTYALWYLFAYYLSLYISTNEYI